MFTLPKLPFEKDALEPYISSETIEYHYGKHHQWYVNNLNALTEWKNYSDDDLLDVIKNSEWWIFNNAAQVYNHTFYWNCLAKNAWWNPKWEIAELINRDFWSFEEFKDKFSKSAATNFGSGWTWLVLNDDSKLEIINTSNADTVITTAKNPLLVIDIWEHAYYIDTRNDRPKYIENFWNLVNWDFVNNNLK